MISPRGFEIRRIPRNSMEWRRTGEFHFACPGFDHFPAWPHHGWLQFHHEATRLRPGAAARAATRASDVRRRRFEGDAARGRLGRRLLHAGLRHPALGGRLGAHRTDAGLRSSIGAVRRRPDRHVRSAARNEITPSRAALTWDTPRARRGDAAAAGWIFRRALAAAAAARIRPRAKTNVAAATALRRPRRGRVRHARDGGREYTKKQRRYVFGTAADSAVDNWDENARRLVQYACALVALGAVIAACLPSTWLKDGFDGQPFASAGYWTFAICSMTSGLGGGGLYFRRADHPKTRVAATPRPRRG